MEGRIFGHTVTENSLTRLSGSLNFCPLRSRCCSRALKKSLAYKAEEILRREEEGGGKIGGSRWNVESQLSSRARAAAPCPAGCLFATFLPFGAMPALCAHFAMGERVFSKQFTSSSMEKGGLKCAISKWREATFHFKTQYVDSLKKTWTLPNGRKVR